MKNNCDPIKSCGQTVIPQTDDSQLDCDIIVSSNCVNVSKDYLTLQILKDDKLTDLLDKIVKSLGRKRIDILELIPTVQPQNPFEGNLYYDSTINTIRYYNGIQWVDIGVSGTGTDSQTLSINGLNLSITGGNTVALPPETTTTLVDNGTSFTYTNEEGVTTTVTLPTNTGGGSGIENLVEDLTPQLGGDLDLNGNDIPVSPTQQTALNTKQETLVSGTNIKTINGESLLGATDIVIPPETVTNIVDNGSDFTYTNEQGTATTITFPVELPSGNLGDTLYNNGTEFIKATPVIEKPTGLTGNTITLSNTPLTTNEFYFDLLINIPRIEGVSNDYTISGNTITTNFTLQATDVIRVKYLTA